MIRIDIAASRRYEVLVQRGLLARLGALSAQCVGPCSAMLVSDDRVFSLYGAQAEASLREAGFSVDRFVFPHGEQQKSLATYGALLNALCSRRFTRSDLIVALGGGVTGDLAGFAAATYLRGVRFVQVPTTLLAMVDSSVGGKTAIDLDGGKNQAGAFYQPSLVLCDPEALSTLPEEEYRCGCAEIIKYALLGSRPLFDRLRATPVRDDPEPVIAQCVSMKRDIVQADEYDRGCRQTLNLGHTVGHAVEACSGFTLLHGQAVAIGTAILLRAAAARGFCTGETAREGISLLEQYGLPTETDYPLDALYQAALSDKKLEGGRLHLIVPEAIGRCLILEIPAPELRDWMKAGGVK